MPKAETLSFGAEVKDLLNLMIHSLYSNKEIFLRELISNSSDALEKLNFKAISDPEDYKLEDELKIHVTFDKENKTITIADNGIGMSRDEVISNLGTIAKSGTKEFLEKLSGDKSQDSRLIGQFGVGFYSSFIVAERVIVETRRANLSAEQGVCWESSADGEYTLSEINKENAGTTVTLYLKETESEFLEGWSLRNIITKYSNHIAFPILMLQEAEENKEAEFEQINTATALWMRAKKDITEEEYNQFYQEVSNDYQAPLAHMHNRVEGSLEYTSLLYIPQKAPFDMWNQQSKYGLKLYVQRVFIMDDVEQFLPSYLRFVRGIIDSNDLPLNVSREILQSNKTVDNIKSALTKKALNHLASMARDDKEKYAKFWQEFGQVLKEGPAEDFENREKIAEILLFSTTHTDAEIPTVTLDEYISRMKDGQDKIYYVAAETFAAAKNSPYLEALRSKGLEVLLLSDRVDEWLMSNMMEFKNKKFQSVSKGNLDLSAFENKEDKEKHQEVAKTFEDVVKKAKDILGDKVKEVRTTNRLSKTPACIVVDENEMGLQMQRIMQAAGQFYPGSKPIFELNPEHPLVSRLKDESNENKFKDWICILYDQALLAESGQLPDPASFLNKMNEMLLG